MPKTQSYQNHVKIAKNEHLLTFLLKNFFWWVVRQHRRFQKMPEIPKTCLTTYNDVATAIEYFLQPSEVSHVSKKFQIFLLFPLNFGLWGAWESIKSQKWASTHVLFTLKRLMHRMMTLFVSARSYDPKEVFRNLLWHRSTLRKFSTALAGKTNFLQNTHFEHFLDAKGSKQPKSC